ncbi:MAG: acetyltransferase [Haloplasmataceae bacterium]|nr:acetyltransferase [Haloplasmataceae bacterium]
MEVILQKANLALEEAYYDFIKDWDEHNEQITPYSASLLDMSYKEWLEQTSKIEVQATCPKHFVPAHTYFLVQNNKIIGAINIRHYLNDYLFNFGGHIGYGIRPTERKKGYATQMLKMALPIARELGINKALITCDKSNIGSRKTIVKNGGVLENEVVDNDEIVQRYWINL